MQKKNEKDGWRRFVRLCSQCKNPEELEEILDLFLTLEEKEDLSKRYLIVKALLDEKLTQREIASGLHVSISKITRGSNALKTTNPQTKGALKEKIK
jgi:TrpR family trp operon transcriptional repressor